MRIGIIAEGKADIAVITNILKGLTGLDSSEFVPLRPITSFDKTHLAHLDPDQKGGWTLVKKECIEKKKIESFFALADSTHVVIHLDSSEAEEYPVKRPEKNYHEYCKEIRKRTIAKIEEWLGESSDKFLYAVAVEETESWVLILYDNKNSCSHVRPKEKLQRVLQKKGENTTGDFGNYLRLTKPFAKARVINDEQLLSLNCSLAFFCSEARQKLLGQKNS